MIVATILIAVPMLPKPGNQQAERPEIRAVPGRECLRRQRRVGKPSHVRSIARPVQAIRSHQAEIKKKASECRQPETKSIQTRERHVARANHQRDQIIRKSEQNGHGHEENHRGPMHGEHAVEHLRRDEIVVRADELDAHDRRFDPADHEKEQSINDVHNAKPLVIDGRHPLVKRIDERTRPSVVCRAMRLNQSTS